MRTEMQRGQAMTIRTLELEGKEFVVLSRKEFDALMERAGVLPPLPPADAGGTFPALETARAAIAREIITRRIALGWTQQELARQAGLRVESLSRLESGKHKPQRETILRIDQVLVRAEKSAVRKRAG